MRPEGKGWEEGEWAGKGIRWLRLSLGRSTGADIFSSTRCFSVRPPPASPRPHLHTHLVALPRAPWPASWAPFPVWPPGSGCPCRTACWLLRGSSSLHWRLCPTRAGTCLSYQAGCWRMPGHPGAESTSVGGLEGTTLGWGGGHAAVRSPHPPLLGHVSPQPRSPRAPTARHPPRDRFSVRHPLCFSLQGSQSQAEVGRTRFRVQTSPRSHHAAPEEAEDQCVQGAQVRRVRLHHGEPAAVPRAHSTAQVRRLVPPVPRVRPLLHVARLPVPAPLHRPQTEGAAASGQAERGRRGEPAGEQAWPRGRAGRRPRVGQNVQSVCKDVRDGSCLKRPHADPRHGLHQIQKSELSGEIAAHPSRRESRSTLEAKRQFSYKKLAVIIELTVLSRLLQYILLPLPSPPPPVYPPRLSIKTVFELKRVCIYLNE